jgi:subtilisin family serine protease
MKQSGLRCGLVAALFALGGAGGAPAAAQQAQDPALRSEVVVKLRQAADLPAVLAAHRLRLLDQLGKRPIYRLQVGAGERVSDKVEVLRRDGRIDFAEPNFVAQTPNARRRNVVWAVGGSSEAAATQWASYALRLPEAHARTRGAEVRVAVLDTGVDTGHEALRERLEGGYDFVDDDRDPSEEGSAADAGFGHGTHVAGLIAQAAPDARIVPIRVLDRNGAGNVWVLAEALLYAVDPDGDPTTDDGARVVNLSVGTTRPTRLLNTAVELATCSDDDDDEADDDYSDAGFDDDQTRCNLLHGSVVVAAAGNSGSATERQYPAAEHAEGALAVTASAQGNRLASFANYGDWVQVAAPGENVLSTLPGNLWGVWSGTSLSTPLTAGVAALVLSVNPDWKPVDVTQRIVERSAMLCGTPLRQVDALAAVEDFVPPDIACR